MILLISKSLNDSKSILLLEINSLVSRACIELLDYLVKKSGEKTFVATYPRVFEEWIPFPLSLVVAEGLEMVLGGASSSTSLGSFSASNSS